MSLAGLDRGRRRGGRRIALLARRRSRPSMCPLRRCVLQNVAEQFVSGISIAVLCALVVGCIASTAVMSMVGMTGAAGIGTTIRMLGRIVMSVSSSSGLLVAAAYAGSIYALGISSGVLSALVEKYTVSTAGTRIIDTTEYLADLYCASIFTKRLA